LTGLYAAYGILAALAARARTGKGQRIEVSMLSASMAFLTEPLANYLLLGEVSDLRSRPRRSQSYAFVARDGKPFAIHLSSPPKFWEALTEAVERPDLLEHTTAVLAELGYDESEVARLRKAGAIS